MHVRYNLTCISFIFDVKSGNSSKGIGVLVNVEWKYDLKEKLRKINQDILPLS